MIKSSRDYYEKKKNDEDEDDGVPADLPTSHGISTVSNNVNHHHHHHQEDSDKMFPLSKAVQMIHDSLNDQEAKEQQNDQEDQPAAAATNQAEATNLSIESIATLHPNANEQFVRQFIRGHNKLHYFMEGDCSSSIEEERDGSTSSNSSTRSHPLKNDTQGEETGERCPQCQKAEFEVCVNVASVLFDLFNVPFATARKGATALINAMPWDAKVRLANIASEYFTDPGNLEKIAKGVHVISEMIIATFGDIGTVISVAFHDLSRKDYAIIAANIAISVCLLFASGGTALVIRLGLKTKTIYGIVNSVVQMKKERNRHSKKRKNNGGTTLLGTGEEEEEEEQSPRKPFATRFKYAWKDKVVSVLEDSDIVISKSDSPKRERDAVMNQPEVSKDECQLSVGQERERKIEY
jgi:hypothetical protein